MTNAKMSLAVKSAISKLLPHAITLNRMAEFQVLTALFYHHHFYLPNTLSHHHLASQLPYYQRPKRGDNKPDIDWLLAAYKHDYVNLQHDKIDHQLIREWIGFAIYISILSYINDNPVQAKMILKKFKMYAFTRTPDYIWFWSHELFNDTTLFTEDNYGDDLALLEEKLLIRHEATLISQHLTVHSTNYKKRANQIRQINQCIEWAYYPERKNKRKVNKEDDQPDDKPSKEGKSKSKKNRKQKTAPWNNQYAKVLPSVPNINTFKSEFNRKFYQPSISDPIEHDPAQIFSLFPKVSSKDSHCIEESVDGYTDTYFIRRQIPALKYRIQPLQNYDASVQQTYMAGHDFELPTNIRYLSQTGYQQVFSYLVSHQNDDVAKLLLFSLITSLPIKTLLTPGFLTQGGLFDSTDKQVFITHRLGVSDRRDNKTKCYESVTDIIRLPLSQALYKQLRNLAVSSITLEDIRAYVSEMKEQLALSYLSHTRIERTLHVYIRRFTASGNEHLADLICRKPAAIAPAIYYSTHYNDDLITGYC